ncbi:MAG: DNA-binding protein [Lachnospiraceae bacterium]|nr:DNA-binding protein [Lachnospiraceae bacterium]
MEYKSFNGTFIVRLDVGDEIVESIKKIVETENIKLAQINGLGGASNFTIGVRKKDTKDYVKATFSGDYEITNLHGNVTRMNGEPYLHLHIGCGNDKNEYYGGHLFSCVIGATAEIFITTYDGIVERKLDEKTGLNLFTF